MALAKADFYYGALLSQLVNSGFAPAIFEKEESRRTYLLSTNYDDFKVYSKYITKPINNNKSVKRWDFNFSNDEVASILNDSAINMFAFICGEEKLKDSEIALLNKEQLIQCIGKDFTSLTRRVSISLRKKGSWNFIVYGTGLEVTVNPLKITRNFENRLEDFKILEVVEI